MNRYVRGLIICLMLSTTPFAWAMDWQAAPGSIDYVFTSGEAQINDPQVRGLFNYIFARSKQDGHAFTKQDNLQLYAKPIFDYANTYAKAYIQANLSPSYIKLIADCLNAYMSVTSFNSKEKLQQIEDKSNFFNDLKKNEIYSHYEAQILEDIDMPLFSNLTFPLMYEYILGFIKSRHNPSAAFIKSLVRSFNQYLNLNIVSAEDKKKYIQEFLTLENEIFFYYQEAILKDLKIVDYPHFLYDILAKFVKVELATNTPIVAEIGSNLKDSLYKFLSSDCYSDEDKKSRLIQFLEFIPNVYLDHYPKDNKKAVYATLQLPDFVGKAEEIDDITTWITLLYTSPNLEHVNVVNTLSARLQSYIGDPLKINGGEERAILQGIQQKLSSIPCASLSAVNKCIQSRLGILDAEVANSAKVNMERNAQHFARQLCGQKADIKTLFSEHIHSSAYKNDNKLLTTYVTHIYNAVAERNKKNLDFVDGVKNIFINTLNVIDGTGQLSNDFKGNIGIPNASQHSQPQVPKPPVLTAAPTVNSSAVVTQYKTLSALKTEGVRDLFKNLNLQFKENLNTKDMEVLGTLIRKKIDDYTVQQTIFNNAALEDQLEYLKAFKAACEGHYAIWRPITSSTSSNTVNIKRFKQCGIDIISKCLDQKIESLTTTNPLLHIPSANGKDSLRLPPSLPSLILHQIVSRLINNKDDAAEIISIIKQELSKQTDATVDAHLVSIKAELAKRKAEKDFIDKVATIYENEHKRDVLSSLVLDVPPSNNPLLDPHYPSISSTNYSSHIIMGTLGVAVVATLGFWIYKKYNKYVARKRKKEVKSMVTAPLNDTRVAALAFKGAPA